jgi:hypothetical protein
MASIAQDSSTMVRAVFKDAAFSFNLRRQATLGDLAEELAYVGRRFGGSPLYVDVLVRSRPSSG